jgi:hypothetical protein
VDIHTLHLETDDGQSWNVRGCDPRGKPMMRRFELGPLLVAVAAVLLGVSLFLDWYGAASAWSVFEIVDVLLAALALLALLAGLGAIAPDVAYVERRWLPAIALATAVIVAAEIINPPPAAADLSPSTGAWLGFAAAILMLVGAVLSLGRVSVSVSVAEREYRQRVAAVDERQQTTDTAAVVAEPAAPDTATAETMPAADPPTSPRKAKR